MFARKLAMRLILLTMLGIVHLQSETVQNTSKSFDVQSCLKGASQNMEELANCLQLQISKECSSQESSKDLGEIKTSIQKIKEESMKQTDRMIAAIYKVITAIEEIREESNRTIAAIGEIRGEISTLRKEIPESTTTSLISLGKMVSQSSTKHNGPANLANDGKYSQNYDHGTCTHTDYEVNPWWQIDLGKQYSVYNVKFWNRGDCCGERLTSLIVQTSDDGIQWGDTASLEQQSVIGEAYNIDVNSNGRFVRLTISKPTPEFLTLCEVEVYGEPLKASLISRGKMVSQSSTDHNGYANLANDEKYSQNYDHGTCTHTNIEVNPWWQIDFGKKYNVQTIKVWNRGDCCGERLTSLIVETSDDGKHWGMTKPLKQQAVNGGVYDIEVNSNGRFVRLRISKLTAEVLTLCEVEVYGVPLKASLISRGKVVSQSSTRHNGPANLANDGKYSQNYDHGTCTHTDAELHPWWQIDLGKKYNVQNVKVWNRGDCCGERLTSLIVETSDDGKHWGMTKPLKQQAVIGEVYNIDFNSNGRFVRLRISKGAPDFLTLCEVEVYGYSLEG